MPQYVAAADEHEDRSGDRNCRNRGIDEGDPRIEVSAAS